MKVYLAFLPIFFLSIAFASAQEKVNEILVDKEFSSFSDATGYYNSQNSTIVINLESNSKITRSKYDSYYHLLDSYSFNSDLITFGKRKNHFFHFASEMIINGDSYEIFTSKEKLIVVKPDFNLKQDKIVYEQFFWQSSLDEKFLAIMPVTTGLRILSFSNKLDKFFLYYWTPRDSMVKKEIGVPKSNFSAAESKKYSKDLRIKYKTAFSALSVNQINKTSLITPAGMNGLYYSDDKIYILSQFEFLFGYNLLEIDTKSDNLVSTNFFVNDVKKNLEATANQMKVPYAAIVDSNLIIRNSSASVLEFHIYNLETKQKIKEYSVSGDENVHAFFPSGVKQHGSLASENKIKKFDNEKTFIKKVNSGAPFINYSDDSNDSITITMGSIVEIQTLDGVMLSLVTGMLGYMANLTLGTLRIIPYLHLYRNTLLYSHIRFSKKTFELSTSQNIITPLDNLLDNFETKDVTTSSSFLMKKGNGYRLCIFNSETAKFDVYKLGPE